MSADLSSWTVSQVDQGQFAVGKLYNRKCKLHNYNTVKDNGKKYFDPLILFPVPCELFFLYHICGTLCWISLAFVFFCCSSVTALSAAGKV